MRKTITNICLTASFAALIIGFLFGVGVLIRFGLILAICAWVGTFVLFALLIGIYETLTALTEIQQNVVLTNLNKKSSPVGEPMHTCVNCGKNYYSNLKFCPYCSSQK